MTNNEKARLMRDIKALKVNEADYFYCSRGTVRNYARAAGIKVTIHKESNNYFKVIRIK